MCPSRDLKVVFNIYSTTGYDYGINYYILQYTAAKKWIWPRMHRIKTPSVKGYLMETIDGHYMAIPSWMSFNHINTTTTTQYVDGHVANNNMKAFPLDYTKIPWLTGQQGD